MYHDLESFQQALSFPVAKQDLQTQQGLSANAVAIVRTDENRVLSVASPNYELVPHNQVFQEALDYLTRSSYQYKLVKGSILKGGARMSAVFEFPELAKTFPDGDVISYRTEFRNSYDGVWSFVFLAGFFRLVCTNGLTVGELVHQIKRKHAPGLMDYIKGKGEDFREFLDRTNDLGLKHFLTMKREMISVDQGIKQIKEVVEKKIWPKKHEETVITYFERRKDALSNDNVFEVYNAFTRALRDLEAEKTSAKRVVRLNKRVFEYCWERFIPQDKKMQISEVVV